MTDGEHEPTTSPYELSPAQNEKIFTTEILPRYYRHHQRVPKPQAHFFGGQPGAGKSSIETVVHDSLDEADGPLTTMEIIGDEFRKFHPDYEKLNALDDQAMAKHTAADSNRWTEQAIDYSCDLKSHVILEGTLRRASITIKTAEKYCNADFRAHLHVLAVHEFTSRVRIIGRYFGQLERFGHGRYTQKSDHDRSYDGFPASLEEIANSGHFDTIHLYDENSKHLLQTTNTDTVDPLSAVLNQIRNTPPDPDPLLAKLDLYEQQAVRYRKLQILDDIRELRQEIENSRLHNEDSRHE